MIYTNFVELHCLLQANSTLGFLQRNLRNFPTGCRKNAYLSLGRSILNYGSIIWDHYQTKDIEKLERVQRQAARFITNYFKSREEGCVTGMLQALELSSLEKYRSINRLVFMYKVVEGLVPAIYPDELLKPAKIERQIKGKQFKDHFSQNIIDRHIINNNRGFIATRSVALMVEGGKNDLTTLFF